MKLVITGATGFVAREVLAQAARRPDVDAVVAVARAPVHYDGPGAAKVTSVTLPDYAGAYPDAVLEALAGADACIWTVAVTPDKALGMEAAAVKRVCHDGTFAGLAALRAARPAAPRPLRFLYMSGYSAARDATKPPYMFPAYAVMRGETENQLLAYAAAHPGAVNVSIARPGYIFERGAVLATAFATLGGLVLGMPSVGVADIAKAMLDQVVGGFATDTLENADLVRLGAGAPA